jgi:hypothetical protein
MALHPVSSSNLWKYGIWIEIKWICWEKYCDDSNLSGKIAWFAKIENELMASNYFADSHFNIESDFFFIFLFFLIILKSCNSNHQIYQIYGIYEHHSSPFFLLYSNISNLIVWEYIIIRSTSILKYLLINNKKKSNIFKILHIWDVIHINTEYLWSSCSIIAPPHRHVPHLLILELICSHEACI